jgi:hypothetical protein
MPKITDLALAAASVLAAIAPAPSALSGPKSPAEFALKTCLPAMEDLTKVEELARESHWFALQPRPFNPNLIADGPRWRANNFFVHTWTWINNGARSPHCFMGLPHSDNKINRDEFFNSIAASVELKPVSDETLPHVRIETFQINSGEMSKVRFSIASTVDGTLSSVMFYRLATSAPAALPEAGR